MNTKKTIVIVCACAMAGVWAQGVVSLAPAAPSGGTAAGTAQNQAAVDTSTVKVQGRGVGATKEAALKDAYRDAIERAVGLYVDAEQMVKNDELVNDQILTQSNAYIEKYDVVKESEADGLFTVRILATVKKTALAKRLGDVMPKQSINLGNDAANLHAQIVTQEKRNEDAVALLQNALKDVKPITQMMTFTLAETKMISRKTEPGRDICFYHFKMALDEKKYFEEYLPSLMKVFDQITVETPKIARLKKVSLDAMNDYQLRQTIDTRVRYLGGDWDEKEVVDARGRRSRNSALSIDDSGRLGGYVGGLHEGDGGVFAGVTFLSDARNSTWCFSFGQYDNDRRYNIYEDAVKDYSAFPVVVITQANALRTNVQAKRYMLPLACAKVLIDWERQNVLGKGRSSYDQKDHCQTVYNIIFKDKNGVEVYSMPVSLANSTLSNTRLMANGALFGESARGRDCIGWYATPFIHADAKEFHRWIGFEIPRDDLPNVASIEIELAE